MSLLAIREPWLADAPLARRRPQKAKGPGGCSGPQLGVACRDPVMSYSYGRTYPCLAMDDRQQRQAARPQRKRDIRPPVCRVGKRLSTRWAGTPAVRRCGGATVRRLVRGFEGRFEEGRFQGGRLVPDPGTNPRTSYLPQNLRTNPRTFA